MPKNLSTEQVEQYKSTFQKYDADKDGKIDAKELADVFKALGMTMTNAEYKDIMNCLGTNKLSEEEFLMLLDEQIEMKQNEFFGEDSQVFRTNGEVSIYESDLKQAMKALGVNVTDTQAKKVFDEADTDKDGVLSYEQFMGIMNKMTPK